jgi:hypothetical protein
MQAPPQPVPQQQQQQAMPSMQAPPQPVLQQQPQQQQQQQAMPSMQAPPQPVPEQQQQQKQAMPSMQAPPQPVPQQQQQSVKAIEGEDLADEAKRALLDEPTLSIPREVVGIGDPLGRMLFERLFTERPSVTTAAAPVPVQMWQG